MLRISTVSIKKVDLKKLCKKKGMSIRRLAMKADVNYVNLLLAVNGKRGISNDYWEKIKKHL